jgi:lipopolysaccharide export system protein LptC
MARWRARSRLVRRMRIVLPGAMAAILTLLTAWVAVGALLSRIGEAHGAALIHMTNARFYGRDNAGRAYVLAAAEASRDDRDVRRIELDRPSLTLDTGAQGPSRVSADRGVFREDDRRLALEGDVTLQLASGGVFRTDRAIADTLKGTVAGPSPVSGSGPQGAISADAFDVYDRGARVVFRGDVHSRFKRD